MVMMVNKLPDFHFLKLKKYYSKTIIFNSFFIGFLFFLFPATLLIIITINVVVLYLYHLLYFLAGLYILLVVLAVFTNKVVIDTLKNYKDNSEELNYKQIHTTLNIVSTILIFTIFITIFTLAT